MNLVVRNSAATGTTLWSARRVTLVRSTMPAAVMSTCSPVSAGRPYGSKWAQLKLDAGGFTGDGGTRSGTLGQ
jgi:hypothetical protein